MTNSLNILSGHPHPLIQLLRKPLQEPDQDISRIAIDASMHSLSRDSSSDMAKRLYPQGRNSRCPIKGMGHQSCLSIAFFHKQSDIISYILEILYVISKRKSIEPPSLSSPSLISRTLHHNFHETDFL